MSILQTTNLCKTYGQKPNIVKALDDVTITVDKGEFVAIVRTSGSGKSTLLHMLGGFDRPTSGSVKVDNFQLGKLNGENLTVFRRRRIGFIFQNYNLVPVLSVWENIISLLRWMEKRQISSLIMIIIATEKISNIAHST